MGFAASLSVDIINLTILECKFSIKIGENIKFVI